MASCIHQPGNYLTVPSIPVYLGLVNINQCCIEVPLRGSKTQIHGSPYRNHEYFILEKDGIPIAGILGIAELEDYLELQNPALKEQIRKGYQGYRQGKVRSAPAFLKELQRRDRK